MPLVEHLYELRNRLAVSLAVIALGMLLVAVFFYGPVFDFVREPFCRTDKGAHTCALYVRDIFGQFQVRLRISAIAGTVLTAPVWLYQLGAFITPALHRKERRYAAGFLGASMVLFAAGVTFAYLTMDKGLDFLLNVGGNGVIALPDLQSYLSFATLTFLAFGFSFLFPVVLVFLNLVGILPADRMRRMWRGMIVGIAVFTAFITPSTDPITFFAMAVPIWLLYGVSLVIATLHDRARRRDQPDYTGLADDEVSPLDTTPSQL